MSDSQSDSEIFSVRIVSIDYYMAPPIPGVDICYSTFHGGKVKEVPVIRVYGSTPSGQKTCLHIHRALPYLYVPCSDIPLQADQEGDAYTYKVAASLEKALQLKGAAGSTRQHVHGCSLVRARRFYGYHSFEELFVKIYLYYPQDVSCAANLLLAGAVLDKSLQPHESHIPFILQCMIDYNLYGMGHLHLSKMKFRHPMPEYSHKKSKMYSQQIMIQVVMHAWSQKCGYLPQSHLIGCGLLLVNLVLHQMISLAALNAKAHRFLISSLKCIRPSHKQAQMSKWFSHLFQYGRNSRKGLGFMVLLCLLILENHFQKMLLNFFLLVLTLRRSFLNCAVKLVPVCLLLLLRRS